MSELVDLQKTLYTSKNPTRRWLHCSRRDWIIDAIARYAPENSGQALEIGPGSGVYLPTLAKLFPHVTATDIEPEYLADAKRLLTFHPNIRLLIDDITATKLPEAAFDLILCSEVVEHIPDSRPAIAAMSRLLKPGCFLILSTPQRWSTLELAARVAFLPGIVDVVRRIYGEAILEMGHINLMTRRALESQLLHAGFRIVERHTAGLYLPIIAEFCGEAGLRLARALEGTIRNGMLGGLLWTQFYVATRSR